MNIDLQAITQSLAEQRWFGSKGRTISSVDVIDHGVVEDGPPAFAITLVQVDYEEGPSEIFHMPLLVEDDGSARDAFGDSDKLAILGDLMAHSSSIKGEKGVFEFEGPGLNPTQPPGTKAVRVSGAEQSNTSVIFDDEVILKTFRKVEPGTNPDVELTRRLTAEGFEHIPAHVGDISYVREEDDATVEIDLGIAQRFVPEAAEGWVDTLERMHRLYDQADPADVPEDYVYLVEERSGDLLQSLSELGDVTAAMHVALARDEADPELAPEAIDEFDLREWAERGRLLLDELLEAGADQLHPFADGIEARIDRLLQVEDPGTKTRIHGDYHLGQVLRSARGWMILDFEGEPARPLAERREKQSPLRDVAGMLRSFSYAATAALFQRADPDSSEWKRLEPWADTWERVARDRYLTAYVKKSHEGHFLPSDRDELLLLLDVFEVDKALYELRYERSHRPEWVRIPLRGITKIARRSDL